MMRLITFVTLMICVSPTVAFGESPPHGYIGLFADSTHSNWCEQGSGFQEIEMWGWCLPSADGMQAVQFGLQYPENIVPSTITFSSAIEGLPLGALPDGISLAFDGCHHDWLWIFRQTLYILNEDETSIEVIKHQTDPYHETPIHCICEVGLPIEELKIYSNLCINHCASDTLPPYLIEAQIIDDDHLRLLFSETLNENDAQDISRYSICKVDNPTDTIAILSASLLEGGSSVSLILSNATENEIPYTLRTVNIHDLAGNSTINEKNITGFSDLKATWIYSVRYVRCGCSPVNARYALINAGTQSVGAFRIELYTRRVGSSEHRSVYYHEYSGLASGDTLVGSATFTLMEPGGSVLYLRVDDLNQIEEINENNNSRSKQIGIPVDLIRVSDYSTHNGNVAIRYLASALDGGNDNEHFEIYARRGSAIEQAQGDGATPGEISESSAYSSVADGPAHCDCHPDDGWKLVETRPAQHLYLNSYLSIVPSYGDTYWTVYIVRFVEYAVQNGDTVYTVWTSCPDSTYADDSLSPDPPQELIAEPSDEGMAISWQSPPDFDTESYFIYRCDDQSFEPSEANLIAETTETQYLDSDWNSSGAVCYKITAKDHSGNESDPLLIVPQGATGTLLDSYTAAYKNSFIELSWSLIEYDENAEFIISRTDGNIEDYRSLSDGEAQHRNNAYYFRDEKFDCGSTYKYRVEVINNQEKQILFETDAIETPQLPLTLWQNHPNPFNPMTRIRYYLPENCHVRIDIYDISGRRIARLVNENQSKGNHDVGWNGKDAKGTNVASGVYFYKLQAAKETITRKMVILR